jgi:hypothetical protein
VAKPIILIIFLAGAYTARGGLCHENIERQRLTDKTKDRSPLLEEGFLIGLLLENTLKVRKQESFKNQGDGKNDNHES